MKYRTGFVSNSSSCSFSITNTSNSPKTIVDFAKENIYLLDKFNDDYDWYNFTKEQLLLSAKKRLGRNSSDEYRFKPHETKVLVFGDEQNDVIGNIYDYMLRDSNESKNFAWHLEEMLR